MQSVVLTQFAGATHFHSRYRFAERTSAETIAAWSRNHEDRDSPSEQTQAPATENSGPLERAFGGRRSPSVPLQGCRGPSGCARTTPRYVAR